MICYRFEISNMTHVCIPVYLGGAVMLPDVYCAYLTVLKCKSKSHNFPNYIKMFLYQFQPLNCFLFIYQLHVLSYFKTQLLLKHYVLHVKPAGLHFVFLTSTYLKGTIFKIDDSVQVGHPPVSQSGGATFTQI